MHAVQAIRYAVLPADLTAASLVLAILACNRLLSCIGGVGYSA
jgi:hypothetical protein